MRYAQRRAVFSWFSKEKKPLHIGSHTRVGCLGLLSLYVSSLAYVCVCLFVSSYSAVVVHRAQRTWPQGQFRRVLCTHK